MILSLDFDDTVSVYPRYFSQLSHDTCLNGGRVIINSSRSETRQSRSETILQLEDWGIRYDKLYLFKPLDDVEHLCPHLDLDWNQRYLWQKVHYCRLAGAHRHYDDDQDVIGLFRRYAPEITVIDVQGIDSEILGDKLTFNPNVRI